MSSDFILSNDDWQEELCKVLERCEAGKGRVIPILLRPTDWEYAPFMKLEPLPKDGRPISNWFSTDDAFKDVAADIREAVEALITKKGEVGQYRSPADSVRNVKDMVFSHSIVIFKSGILRLLISMLLIVGIITVSVPIIWSHAAINKAHAYATATASSQANQAAINATATADTIAENPYPAYLSGSGTLALYDPMRDNSQGYQWEWDKTTDSAGGICEFTGDGYRVSMPEKGYFEYCPAHATDFSNFAFQVQMNIVAGNFGGIIFRAVSAGSANSKFYVFDVGQDGYYNLQLCTGTTCQWLVQTTFSSSIRQGLNETNLIAVEANGNSITLYVNQQQITNVTDSTYNHGQIGLIANLYSDTGNPTEVVYSNAKVWVLN